jgi:hypothetical protein
VGTFSGSHLQIFLHRLFAHLLRIHPGEQTETLPKKQRIAKKTRGNESLPQGSGASAVFSVSGFHFMKNAVYYILRCVTGNKP